MKHVFIVNPSAGKISCEDHVRSELERNGIDAEIYVTKAPLDAVRYVRERCAAESGEVRFYACGGDGTLSEVVNGAAGRPNASVSCFPLGSGNDFVKYYGGGENFTDIAELCAGENHPIDLIKVNGVYSVNVVNFGLDSYVAKVMQAVKKKPIIGGRNAYTTGLIAGLLKSIKNHAVITADGETVCGDVFMLCTVANGLYVGGEYKCAPRAANDDGLLEFCMVDPVSYIAFARLVGSYRDGRYLEDPRFEKIVHYRRCRRVTIDSPDGIAISVDGEIYENTHFEMEVMPSALMFGVPRKAAEFAGTTRK